MPTKISHYFLGGLDADTQKIIGFCKESPIEVLESVYKTHAVHTYRGIFKPFSYKFNSDAPLVISRGKSPPVTAIVGSVTDLDLSAAEIKLEAPITKHMYRAGLRNAILDNLSYGYVREGRIPNYLEIRDEEKGERFEKCISYLLEIAHIILGIEKPTVKNLERILWGHEGKPKRDIKLAHATVLSLYNSDVCF